MNTDELLLHLAVSLAIGLLIGAQRAWHQRSDQKKRAAGIRTFALAGLVGGLSGELGRTLGGGFAGFAFLAFTGVFTFFQAWEAISSKSVGATTAVAGLAVFLLGAMAAVGNTQVAVALAIATAAVLTFREFLHNIVARMSWVEVRDGVILLAMAFLMLPVLPDRAFDPWNALNPHEVWIIATLIAAVSYVGWLAVRSFGERLGILLVSAIGGLTSSTATTISLARMTRIPTVPRRLLAAGMCVSGAVSTVRIGVLVMILRPPMLPDLAPAYLAVVAALGLFAVWLLREGGSDQSAEGFELGSPLDLMGALRMAALFAGVILVTGYLRSTYGDAGFYLVSLVSGLVDLAPITVTASRMGGPELVAAQGLLLATATNLTVKVVMATTIGGREVARPFALATALAIATGVAAVLLVP